MAHTETLNVIETPTGWRAEVPWSTDPIALPIVYAAWFVPCLIVASLLMAGPPAPWILGAAAAAGLLTALHAGLLVYTRREPLVVERDGDRIRAHRYGMSIGHWPAEGVPVDDIDGARPSQEQILVHADSPLRIPCEALPRADKRILAERLAA